ncbi:hypothetical protein PybrP1_005384 [[Pythium] brassicae (nom. inval.)]|nr:hypothetical protein PybrP1_005384 [[Pythium] brassicae (nom. inval.)]
MIGGEETAMLVAIQAGREDVVVALFSRYSGVKADSGWTVLHMAAASGCERAAEELLRRYADASAVAASGETPLHVAAARGRTAIVTRLLVSGAKVDANIKDSCCTALYLAAKRGHWMTIHVAAANGHVHVVAELANYGADVNTRVEGELATPLFIAARFRRPLVVKKLLELGADLDTRDKNQWTRALQATASSGCSASAAALLAHGADPNASAVDESTPLHDAVGHGYTDIVALLLSNGADVNARWENGETALHLAVRRGFVGIVMNLLANGADADAVDRAGDTPFHRACDQGHKHIVSELLANGANPMITDRFGRTALYRAAVQDHSDIVAALLAHGADPNAMDSSLIGAVDYGFKNIVMMLLAHGAHVNSVERTDSTTPLHHAASLGYVKIVIELLERGADLNAFDDHGETVLSSAITRDDNDDSTVADNIVAGWRQSRASDERRIHFSAQSHIPRNQNDSGAASGERCQCGARTDEDRTPLHVATCEASDTDIVRVLLADGADIEAADFEGLTPLDHAVTSLKSPTITELRRVERIRGFAIGSCGQRWIPPDMKIPRTCGAIGTLGAASISKKVGGTMDEVGRRARGSDVEVATAHASAFVPHNRALQQEPSSSKIAERSTQKRSLERYSANFTLVSVGFTFEYAPKHHRLDLSSLNCCALRAAAKHAETVLLKKQQLLKVPDKNCVSSSEKRAPFRSVRAQPLEHVERVRVVHRSSRAALAPMLVQPLDDVEVTVLRSSIHRIRRAAFRAVRVQPLHNLKMTACCRRIHRSRRTALGPMLVQPANDGEMPICCSIHRRACAAFSAVRVQPLDNVKVPARRCTVHRQLCAALRSVPVQPLYDLKTAFRCCRIHCPRRAAFSAVCVQPLDDPEMPSACRTVDRVAVAHDVRDVLVEPLDGVQVARGSCNFDPTGRALCEPESVQPLEHLQVAAPCALRGASPLHRIEFVSVLDEEPGDLEGTVRNRVPERLAVAVQVLIAQRILNSRDPQLVQPSHNVDVPATCCYTHQLPDVERMVVESSRDPLHNIQMSATDSERHDFSSQAVEAERQLRFTTTRHKIQPPQAPDRAAPTA